MNNVKVDVGGAKRALAQVLQAPGFWWLCIFILAILAAAKWGPIALSLLCCFIGGLILGAGIWRREHLNPIPILFWFGQAVLYFCAHVLDWK